MSYYGFDPNVMRHCRGQPKIAKENLTSAGDFSSDTTHKMSYGAWPGFKPPHTIVPADHKLLGEGPISQLTTHKHDYTPKPLQEVDKVIQPGNLGFSDEPMDDKTTANMSYQVPDYNRFERATSYKPQESFNPPRSKMDDKTTHKLSYQPFCPPAKEEFPWAKKDKYRPPIVPFEGSTIYNGSYFAPGQFVEDCVGPAGCYCMYPGECFGADGEPPKAHEFDFCPAGYDPNRDPARPPPITETVNPKLGEGIEANHLTESVPRFVKAAGYPIEEHKVKSGEYKLSVHRLPQPTPGAPAVMVVHGLFCSSVDWILDGPKKALGYLLHDGGMDVWLANLRGTPASMQHETLNPNQWKFWNFTFEEQGVEDVISITDYILQVTQLNKIHYVGNSMGSSSLLVGLSERPEYNAKFHQAILYAPHTNMNNIIGFVRTISMLEPFLQKLTKTLGIAKFPMGNNDAFLAFSYTFCQRQTDVQVNFCVAIHDLLLGGAGSSLNAHLFLEFTRYYPTSASMKTLLHILQNVGKDRFVKFDYGADDNMKLYGTSDPKPYNLKKVEAPVVVFYAKNDKLVPPKDIEWLKEQLPKTTRTFYISRDDFGHTGFLWHPDIKELVYKPTVSLISNFT